MKPEIILEPAVKQAVKQLYGAEIQDQQIQLQKTRKEFEGDITLVVFPLLKVSGKGPEVTAAAIGEMLVENCVDVQGYNVVKGFLNISLSENYWKGVFQSIIHTPEYGVQPRNGDTLLVEYASPNTNKPLHLGHLRNIFLGHSVSNILDAAGFDVKRVQVINDRGIHICKSMLAWQLFGNGETPESSGIKGDHLIGKYYVLFDRLYKEEIQQLIQNGEEPEEAAKKAPLLLQAQEMLRKWEAGDPQIVDLWRTMNGWVYQGFGQTYARMNVDFDKLYYESDTYILGKEVVREGLEKGVFYKKDDGSVWIDLSAEGLDHKLLLRSDGTAVYITQDIGTAILRSRDFHGVKGMIYTVGNEQDYHFKVLFLILEKLGYGWAKQCYHLSYGMVDLPSGKMKSREGTVVDADDLMDEMLQTARQGTESLGKLSDATPQEKEALNEKVGMAALKYFLLKVEPRKRMLFDPNESIDFQGHTGPFIQYTYARIQSLLQKGENILTGGQMDNYVPGKAEREVIKILFEYPEMVKLAATDYSPAVIANYVYELVKEYNQFYQNVTILKEENQQAAVFRLKLSKSVSDTIQSAMNLLGIEVPARM
jgi:arginyl-tRNA synthetase